MLDLSKLCHQYDVPDLQNEANESIVKLLNKDPSIASDVLNDANSDINSAVIEHLKKIYEKDPSIAWSAIETVNHQEYPEIIESANKCIAEFPIRSFNECNLLDLSSKNLKDAFKSIRDKGLKPLDLIERLVQWRDNHDNAEEANDLCRQITKDSVNLSIMEVEDLETIVEKTNFIEEKDVFNIFRDYARLGSKFGLQVGQKDNEGENPVSRRIIVTGIVVDHTNKQYSDCNGIYELEEVPTSFKGDNLKQFFRKKTTK